VGAGALGARMMGGGFGGSVIALVPAGDEPGADPAGQGAVGAAVAARFAGRGWAPPVFFGVAPSAGARRLQLPNRNDRMGSDHDRT
jgi:galactokinase